jgi:hypothetical protein
MATRRKSSEHTQIRNGLIRQTRLPRTLPQKMQRSIDRTTNTNKKTTTIHINETNSKRRAFTQRTMVITCHQYTCEIEYIPVTGLTKWKNPDFNTVAPGWSGLGNLLHFRTRPGVGPMGPQENNIVNNFVRDPYDRRNNLVTDNVP